MAKPERKSERFEAQRRAWQRTRARGERSFLFTRGVLGRGLPMALVLGVGVQVYLGHEFPASLVSPGFLGRVALALAFFSVGGVMNAKLRWNLYEKRFGPDS